MTTESGAPAASAPPDPPSPAPASAAEPSEPRQSDRPSAPASAQPGFGRPPYPSAPSRLMRESSDKVLAGVCGGLGRHTGVDPILFRIGFVALAFAGGTGVLLYIALAVLMPRNDGQQVWARGSAKPRVEPEIRPDMRIGDREREQTVACLGTAHAEGQLDLVEYDERVASAYQAKIAADLIELTSDLALASRGHPAPFSTVSDVARPAPLARPTGPRSPIPGLTLAILLIGAGIVAFGERYGDWSVGPSTYLGIALALIGGALVATAFGPWRRSKGALITLGVLLSIGLFFTSTVESQGGFEDATFGERSYRPASAEQVQDSYRVLMGEGTLDLSGVELSSDDPTEIRVDVTMGDFRILVPRDVDVELNGEASFGSLSVFGNRDVMDGFYQGSGGGPGAGDDEPELILDVDVRFGNAEVTRVG